MRLWLALLPACGFGVGGTTVGEWRAKRVVESEACVVMGPDPCGKVIQIGRDEPARGFGGGNLAFAVPGYAHASGGGASESAFTLGGSFEYLRGRGGLALGGRIGMWLLDGSVHSWLVMPVTAVVHYGGAWGSVFGGLGYAPLVSEARTGAPTAYLHDGLAALAGTELVLRETLGHYITLDPEVRYQRAGDATILSFSVSLGLHL